MQPLAQIDLLLSEGQRTYRTTDIRLGGITLQSGDGLWRRILAGTVR
ncbi:hypothetical protein [Actinocorallia longicatena]|uniref:Uncharacterized protein n=1 Tax=Actinocorallia longicatena TaxID=111803 RepID=A0ABP6Q8E8_9ACTN